MTYILYLRRRKDGCDDFDPRVMCEARRNEVWGGSFWYDEKRQGYCYRDIEVMGVPVLLDACPFCNELLPGAETRRRFEAWLTSEES